MFINKKIEQATLFIAPAGRLDTTSAPEFENELNASLGGVKKLVLDLKDIAYVSSAGLRVILKAQKTMMSLGGMRVIGVNSTVMDVFQITGFADVLAIE